VKGPWTSDEDTLLSKLVMEYGPKKWSVIASHVPGRIGKQCRERWLNHLDSTVKKDPWSEEEDMTLIHAQERIGNRWCEISKMLPGRPENAVKNRWNSLMNRRFTSKSPYMDDNLNAAVSAKVANAFRNNTAQYSNNVFVPANSAEARSPGTSKKKTQKGKSGTRASTAAAKAKKSPINNVAPDYSFYDWTPEAGAYPYPPYTSKGPTKIKTKSPPPPLVINNNADFNIGSYFDAHGTPKGASSLFGGTSPTMNGEYFSDLDLLGGKTPTARSPLTSSLVGLSIDDDLGDLMHIPLAATPKQFNRNIGSKPKLHINASADFGIGFDQIPFSILSNSGFDFDAVNTPKLQVCHSPVAQDMLHLNSMHREGKITAGEKSKLKDEILKMKEEV